MVRMGLGAAFGLPFFVCAATVITSVMGRPPRFFVWHRRREGRWVDAWRRRAHGKR
jgi:hypothetical protein